jgi:hypothetical protein
MAFDVIRPDWREWLRDRAFRHGLILLPAGERTLRFYPRYDMEPSALHEALALLRRAVADLAGSPTATPVKLGPELRIGTLEVRPAWLQAVDLTGENALDLLPEILAVEAERYGDLAFYPPDVLKAGRRPLLPYPADTLLTTLRQLRSCGVALRDRVSQRLVAYALGSPLEDHDEVGVRDDPRYGEHDTFYLQAMAVSPQLRNQIEVEAMVLDALRVRIERLGFSAISADRGRFGDGAPVDADGHGAGDDRQLPPERYPVRLPPGALWRGDARRVRVGDSARASRYSVILPIGTAHGVGRRRRGESRLIPAPPGRDAACRPASARVAVRLDPVVLSV